MIVRFLQKTPSAFSFQPLATSYEPRANKPSTLNPQYSLNTLTPQHLNTSTPIMSLKKLINNFGFQKKCPVCGRTSRAFIPIPGKPGRNILCPWCNSRERHRLIWLFFQRKTNLFDQQPKTMLHFAPEKAFEPRLRKLLASGYTSADLLNPADLKVDITDIQLPDNSFDIILCSHVLEHIPDDRKAIRELARVLKPNGWALILVPLKGKETYEDDSITTPAGRLAAFGQSDHVRQCGSDYVERIRSNGFDVTVYHTEDIATPKEQEYFGLRKRQVLYYCKKSIQPNHIL